MAKPSTVFTWAASGTKTSPGGTLIANGFGAISLAYQWLNWILGLIGDWIAYFNLRDAQWDNWLAAFGLPTADTSATQLTLALESRLFGSENVGAYVARVCGVRAATPAASYSGTFHAVTCGRGPSARTQYVAVGSGGTIQRSYNGLVWSAATAGSAYSGALYAVTYGGGLHVAVGASGAIQTSATGSGTWTARTAGSAYSGAFRGVAYNGTVYVAVGDTGSIQSSPDGTTWTARTPAASYAGTFNAIAWAPTLALFVAVGSGGEVQTSPDGIAWTHRTSGTGNDLYAVTEVPTWVGFSAQLYAVGSSQTVVYSADAATWTTGAVLDATGTVAGSNGFWSVSAPAPGVILVAETTTDSFSSVYYSRVPSAPLSRLPQPYDTTVGFVATSDPTLRAVLADAAQVAVGDGGLILVY